MCSLLLTLVVRDRSKIETIHVSIYEDTMMGQVQDADDLEFGTQQNNRADQKQHQREHDKRIGARESKSYDPHKQSLSRRRIGLSSFLVAIAFENATTGPFARPDLPVQPWH